MSPGFSYRLLFAAVKIIVLFFVILGFLWCTVSFQRKLARVLPPAWAVCRKNFCWAADGEIGAPDERWTVMSAESYWLERFSRKSVPEPKLSVRNLLASVLGFTDVCKQHFFQNTMPAFTHCLCSFTPN